MYGQFFTNSVCLYAFLYIFVYIYAQIYTLYKYIHVEVVSIQSNNGSRDCKTKEEENGCGDANKEERFCDIPSCLFFFLSFVFHLGS